MSPDPVYQASLPAFEMPCVSRQAIGLALSHMRKAAGELSLENVCDRVGTITVSTLSRSERAERDVTLSELTEIGRELHFGLPEFFKLAETFEREIEAERTGQPMSELKADLNRAMRTALMAATAAMNEHMAMTRQRGAAPR